MTNPKTITATYRIVTPMFIGDADHVAELVRPPSIKGGLRFWWRALNWASVQKNNPEKTALHELHKQENSLFGCASDKGPGQSQFILRINSSDLKCGKPAPLKPRPGIQYLLGQGLFNLREGYLRDAVLSGEIQIKCVLKPTIKEHQKIQITDALLALGLLGGLGSRARNGFGSLAIQSLLDGEDSIDIPKNVTEYKSTLSKWLNNSAEHLPPITAFSQQTRIDISSTNKDPEQLLNRAGEEMQFYRSYGRDGKVNRKDAEKNFKNDHDNVLKIANGATPKSLPKRSVFGFPHNYFYSSSGQRIDINPSEKNRSRRASPLFIHIHEFPNGQALLVQSLLPATFLPQGEKVKFKPGRGSPKNVQVDKDSVDWKVIHRYLDRFIKREKVV